ncbi:Isopentenyl-diphosphate Delta-isomerase 1 [Nosema granulosis]|uniref:isopentenyl-diphosphate Delta-isomerase n=1 Tax=Nosema granulosis TaxID=83296 RepID=A0A9P6H391_9MICR|nr:Isopentenyl-diphosphate Delta-isomerase 1 [Nosema granulosis]
MDNFNKNIICVDSNDSIVGTEKASKAHTLEHLTLHRAFSLFLFNTNNKLLIQKRSSTKYVFPGLWANTVCSHPFLNPLSFSDPLQDAKNHVVERLGYELGITNVTTEDLRFVTRLRYKATEDEFYGQLMDGVPLPQEVDKKFNEKFAKKFIFNPNDTKWGEWEVDYVFICKKDVVVKPNPDEVAEYLYIDEEEFREFSKTNLLSPWKKLIVKYVNVFDLIK